MKYLSVIVFLFISSSICYSQSDSIYSNSILDTLSTALSDSLSLTDQSSKKAYDVDTVIYSKANDSLIFFVKDKKMKLFGEGELNYKDTDLKAANIFLDFQTNNIEATGVKSDSIKSEITGSPVLKDKGETYEGFRMKYNFKTKRGLISSAQTESEGTHYTGSKIKKVDDNTYFVQDGIYTTCSEKEPHYCFYSHEMKVVNKEQISAKWIWLLFADVPFPIPLPFAVFPIESGRRSGIIPPAFGDDGTYGRYFSRFGYFWAMSDYMDLALQGDYYTRGSYRFDSRFRYAKRYDYSGSLEAQYEFLRKNEITDADFSEQTNWRLIWNHNQNFDPSSRFDARLEFMSGNTLQRNLVDFNDVLRNEIRSNATFFKNWDESGNSLSLSYSRRQVLETGEINEILPNLSFTVPQKYPFKRKISSGDQKWYELIGYNYSGQFQNNRDKQEGQLKIRGGIQHNINLSASPKIGYISVTPNFRYQEKWYNKRIEQSIVKSAFSGEDSVVTKDVKEINFIRTFSAGIGASTRFYGIFQPNMLGVSSIRHTVNPSISYNYQPDFSDPKWGYFGAYYDSSGKKIIYNKFQEEIFGGATSGEQQSLSFSVSNIFEMKTSVDPTDTTSKEKKIQLLNLDAGISYNLAADSIKFSKLSVGYRTQIGDWLNLFGNSIYTLYETDENGREINQFLINNKKGLLRLTNFQFSVSTTLSGEKLQSDSNDETKAPLPEGEFELGSADRKVYQGLYNDRDPDFSIPWDLSLSYNYMLDKSIPSKSTSISNMSGSLNFNLTPNWKFSVTGSYDFDRKEFSAPQIKVSRDLHCWLMNFTWNPIGTFRGYRFEIRVKAPQLQDLKVTKQDQFYEGR
ncbi:MAG: LPS-assembly protein LptD [Ignavibacteriaceae bacterium]|nr:LPS-assembly protein LptD [Ignavibacteriaceae bacterium]